jgi:ketosteroid isomerase-like protein
MNRKEWLDSGKYTHLESFDIGNLVAETFDHLALAHFTLNASGRLGQSAEVAGPYVVTDLWSKEQGKWKLRRRFLSSPAPLPGRYGQGARVSYSFNHGLSASSPATA